MDRRNTSALLLLVLCVYASESTAAPSSTAEAAIRDGKNSYNSGDYEAAIQSFKFAYTAEADNEVLYRLGKAYAMADWPVEAVAAFERYLSAAEQSVSDERRREVVAAINGQRRRIGSLIVQVTPAHANVKVDDAVLAGNAYATPLPLRQGSHLVAASLDGYLPQLQVAQIRPHQPSVVRIELQPVAPKTRDGLLIVRCPLPAVTLLVDDHQMGATPVEAPVLLSEGPHGLRLERAGYQSQTVTIQISRARATTLDCNLPMAKPLESSGQLSFGLPETTAIVFIDGLRAQSSNVLPPGLHAVEVRHYGFEPWARQLRVDAGSSQHVDVMLTPTQDYLRDVDERAQQRRVWSYWLGATGVAIAGTALGIGLWNNGRYDDWQRKRTELELAYKTAVTNATAAELEQRRRDVNGQLRSIHSIDIATAILGVAGGMLLGTGTLLWLTIEEAPRHDGHRSALRRVPQGIGMNVAW